MRTASGTLMVIIMRTTTHIEPSVAPAAAGAADEIRLHPLTPAIGAVVTGVDTSRPLDPVQRERFTDALHEFQVLFLRDRVPATTEQFAAFAGQFGALGRHPVDEVVGRNRSISVIEDTADHPPAGFDWHTDLSWVEEPPHWGFLRAVEIPACGGDTLWASGREMYRRLSAAMRDWCRVQRVAHLPDPALLASIARHHGEQVARELLLRNERTVHPLVRAHPVTGAPALWLCPLSAARLVGVDAASSESTLAMLNRGIAEPEVQVRWKWRAGDIAVWDETSTVHRALTDHAPARRVMERCTTTGSRPRPAT